MKQKLSILLVLAIALVGSYKYIGGYVTVSSNVNGKELPIYCVETNSNDISLTFDCAWGAEDMPQILAGAMGDYFYIACFETQEEADAFIQYVQM